MAKPKKSLFFSEHRMSSPSPKKREFSSLSYHLIAIGLIVGVAFLVYSNSFSVPFQFDDRPNITQNPNIQIKVLTWDRIEFLIQHTYRETIRLFSYLTLALNYYFGEFNVFGYHLVNLFIHVFAGIFLYGFLILTFNLPSLKEKYGALSYKVALFTSLIFIAHPIQTQSVTYIVQRMTSLAGMFYLLAFVFFIKGRLAKGKACFFYFGGAVLSYLLGIFSKENAAILPFFIALYEFYFFRGLDLSPRGKKIVFALIGALLILGAFGFFIWGQRYIQVTIEGYQYRTFTMSERVLTQFRVVLYYLSLLIYPHPSRLNLDYDFPISKSILDPPTTLISVMVVIGLIGYSFWIAKKRPLLSFCILWYFGNLAIESSIFPLEMVFEHRLYLPSIGPFILFGLAVVGGIEKWKERWVAKKVPILFAILVALSMGAYARNSLWKSEIELWKDCVRKAPQKERTHHNLGFAYYEEGCWEDAKKEFEAALALNPCYTLSMYNLGLVYYREGMMEKAIDCYKEALDLDGFPPETYYNLGLAYYQRGSYADAVDAFQTFIELKPDYENAYNHLGLVYQRLKQRDQAMECFEEELRRNPENPFTNLYLGDLYYELKNYPKALAHFRRALANPNLSGAERVRKIVASIEGNQKLKRGVSPLARKGSLKS